MKSAAKIFSPACLILLAFLLAACSGVPSTSGGGGGGGGGGTTGPFTISVSVAGLSGSGLVLADNVTDQLKVTSNGTFAFATTITKGATYAVTVLTQPLNPAQICVIPQGATGTANASVTISVSCTTGAYTIGGQVNQLQGSGLVLQDNLGNNVVDKLNITANGSFTFATPVASNGAYSVTVLTQPTKPTQTCIVADGSGNASNNVGNIVVTCSVGTIPIGGSVVGLDGTGLTLLDNGGDSLVITGNGPFTFPTLLVSGVNYTVTIGAQPSGPSQICTVGNATGTAATPGITNVQVVCPPVFEPIGGQVVGLSLLTGQTSQLVLQNNQGDNLSIAGNGPFVFNTQIAYGSKYDVSVFVAPGQIQNEGSIIWGYQGTAITPVTDVTVDWGHNDWTWMNGSNKGNQNGAFSPITFPITTFVNNTPGGRKYSATWTDHGGNLWLFGGYGYTYNTAIGPQPFQLDEMWEYVGTQNYFGGIYNYWNFITPLPPPAPFALTPSPRWGSVSWTDPATGHLMLFGGQEGGLAFMNDFWEFTIVPGPPVSGTWTNHGVGGADQKGVYGNLGASSTSYLPGGRWGATSQLDSSGILWLFGGFGYDATSATPGLLNDLWTYNTNTGQWTWVSGSNQINQDGVYGTVGTPGGGPGGRQAAVSWLDNAGNFWVFGGYNAASSGQPGYFNDLWEYNVGTGQWTWMSGASSINQVGNYGTQGVSAATNVPGARWSSAAWTDVAGNLWLFGGQGYDPAGNGSLGDLWAYNPNAPANPVDPNPGLPASGQWVWVKGPNSVSQPGIYGIDPSTTFGVVWPHVTNNLSSRYGASYWTWVDGTGQSQFFLFGGEGFDSTTTNGNGLLDDLQRYLPYP
jgi:hypothetical protein